MPDDEKPPRSGKFIKLELTPEFAEVAASRGVDPGVLMQELMDRSSEMIIEAKQLFDDWDDWPQDRQMRFILDGARERTNLKFPPVEE